MISVYLSDFCEREVGFLDFHIYSLQVGLANNASVRAHGNRIFGIEYLRPHASATNEQVTTIFRRKE